MTNAVRRTASTVGAATLTLLLVAAWPAPPAQSAFGDSLVAAVRDAGGTQIGTVSFTEVDRGRIRVHAQISGLSPGWHGFHVHAAGVCEPPGFATAGGHYDPGQTGHGQHAGDMPSLFARQDGTARTTFVLDWFSLADISGRAVIVHADPDNFARIPDRYVSQDPAHHFPGYTSGPDRTTLDTGDAGANTGCGVIQPGTPPAPSTPAEGSQAVARLIGADGQPTGVVSFTTITGAVRVQTRVWGLTPGFHGFHVHDGAATGDHCRDAQGRPDFARAGDHYDPGGTSHGAHAGDLQILRANADGTARATFVTDRFTVDQVTGRAVVVRALPDNFGHIPARYVSTTETDPAYTSGPDSMTRATGDAGDPSACGTIAAHPTTRRLSGPGRIQTAVAASQDLFPETATAVVLARADLFPDALAGTPLARAKGGPVLLTPGTGLHPDTRAELLRVLPAGRIVYLLGGHAALGAGVESQVVAMGYQVRRLSGPTRIDTALAIARELGEPETLLITTGYMFPDALAAGAAAAHVNGAVLLTVSERRVSSVDAYLAERPTARKFAVGGPAARPYTEATPVVGATREQTAVAAAERFFGAPSVAGLARRGGAGDDTDDTFADALVGGTHVAHLGGPVLLTPTGALHSAVAAYVCGATPWIDTGFVYGGTAAVSEAAFVAFDGRVNATLC